MDTIPHSEPIRQRFRRTIYRLEDGILIGIFILMLSLAVAQVLLRNLFDSGLVWGDTLVRILVLWISLAGATAAGRDGRHISIDVISRFLPGRAQVLVAGVVELAAAVICALLFFYSLKLVYFEFEDGRIAFAQVPIWICQAVIPLGFGVIGLRYLARSLEALTRSLRPRS